MIYTTPAGFITFREIYEMHRRLAKDYRRWAEVELPGVRYDPAGKQILRRLAAETEIIAGNIDRQKIFAAGWQIENINSAGAACQ